MTQKILSLLFLISFIGNSQVPELIFHSGFEPLSTETFFGGDIIGRDNSVSPPNDWIFDLESHPNIGELYMYYEGGNSSMRFARIVQDPTNPSNQIFHFWLNQPNVDGSKGRIQVDIYENNDLVDLVQKVRLYLPNDWNIIKNADGRRFGWLTIMEFWNNAGWTEEDYPFRLTLQIHKNEADSTDLTFYLAADTKPESTWETLYSERNTSFSIPVEQWMTLEVYYKEGNEANGRFVFAVTPDGGARQTVFDITNFTHHPSDPSPDGLKDYNPMKLYTSSNLIDYVRDNGGVLQVYWDDFELWKDSHVLDVPEMNNFSEYKLYPNPMQEYSMLEFNNNTNENHQLKLYNSLGQLVRTIQNIKSNKVVISNENLATGVYSFQLSTEQSIRLTGKLMVY